MQILRFLHSAINVTDLAKAEHFYTVILGLQPAPRDLKFPGIWYQIGDSQLHLLVAPENPPSQNHDRWGRNRHLAFAVADVAAVKQHLTTLHYPFQVSGSGRPAIFVRDPDDNVIELGEI
ncbi:MAG: glyoxalase [Alkalinema sp. RL_2_19]|nr:glyoxalase [Alkalinema sp. RL_2_19]